MVRYVGGLGFGVVKLNMAVKSLSVEALLRIAGRREGAKL
jgi:hypothetical protein